MMGYSLTSFTKMPKGGMGYKSMLKLDGYPVTVLYDGGKAIAHHFDNILIRLCSVSYRKGQPIDTGTQAII